MYLTKVFKNLTGYNAHLEAFFFLVMVLAMLILGAPEGILVRVLVLVVAVILGALEAIFFFAAVGLMGGCWSCGSALGIVVLNVITNA